MLTQRLGHPKGPLYLWGLGGQAPLATGLSCRRGDKSSAKVSGEKGLLSLGEGPVVWVHLLSGGPLLSQLPGFGGQDPGCRQDRIQTELSLGTSSE